RLSALSRDQAGLSLPRPSRLSLCRERLGQCRGESTLYILESITFRFTLILPNLKDPRGKWAPNYKGSYVVKQAFSGRALILTNVEGQDLKYPLNTDSTNKIRFQNAPRNSSFLSEAKRLAFQLSPWPATTCLNEPVPGINIYRTRQKRQRQKKMSHMYLLIQSTHSHVPQFSIPLSKLCTPIENDSP
ncbi:hypothetical protein CR513_34519, partial [Mucuna pruriens]